MNNLIKSEKELLIYFLLKDKLCSDLIQMICNICSKDDLFFLKKKNNLIQEINSLKGYLKPCAVSDEIKPSLKIINFKKDFKGKYPLLYNHDSICGCSACLIYYDNSRYLYIFKKLKEPFRGTNSKLVNNWILFQYYLSTTKKWSRDVQGIDDIYGFTSIYDKYNSFKIDNSRYNTSHIILRNNKGYIIQLQDIWKKINNN